MSLEKLGREILERAEKQAEKSLDEARSQAKVITADGKRRAEERKREILRDAEEEAKGKEREVYAARLQAGKLVGRERDALVRDCLEAVLEDLRVYSQTNAYHRTLERLIAQGKRELGSDAVVYVKKADGALAAKHAKVAGLVQTAGGAVIESRDGRMRVDNTFEALVEEKREELAKRVFAELYGKKAATGATAKPKPAKAKKAAPKGKKNKGAKG